MYDNDNNAVENNAVEVKYQEHLSVNDCHIPFTSRLIELKNFDFHHQPYIIRYPCRPPFRSDKPAGPIEEQTGSFVHLEELAASIRQYGLFSPLIVQENDGRVFIIHGVRRLLACQSLGWTAIPCQDIPSAMDFSLVYQFSLSIFLSHHKPTIMEQAGIIQRLKVFLAEDVIIQDLLPRIGLSPHRKVFDRISGLAELEEEIAYDLSEGVADPQLGWRLLKLPSASRLLVYRFLRQLPFTLSQQFEILEYVQEIAYRDGVSFEELLGQPSLREILASDRDLRQKAGLVRLFFRTGRYPRLTALEEEFAAGKKELHLPERLELYPPHNFEHGNYKFELKFADLAELEQELDFLNRLVKKKNFKDYIQS
ncbi:MAG: ParB N-terminal domain-containing protein [bacterium]